MSRRKVFYWFVCCFLVFGLTALPVSARITFSVDFQGPTKGSPDPSGAMITEGDILLPTLGSPSPGPLPPPTIFIPAGPPGRGLGLASYPRLVEVDALSYGEDKLCGYWHFSVDEFARGAPVVGILPSVTSEGALGNREASADIFVAQKALVHPTVPWPPPGVIGMNLDIIDGDGLPPFGGPGLGLVEPNPPTPQQLPDEGDNLDALDMDLMVAPVVLPVFFSLDSRFVDPLEGPPANSGSAAVNGFVGGDVLVSLPGGPPALYAPAGMLGLDLEAEDLDDVDALVVFDDGDLRYDPLTDFVAFSVRRGSAIIGMPDSIWGVPITEADILVPPLPAVNASDASSMFLTPGILVPGEALGLNTQRIDPDTPFSDDLNALDLTRLPGDCDGNGKVDVFDAIILVNAFGSTPMTANWNPQADLNCDNRVDVFDAIILVNNFGNTW